jgi:membrane-bound lytic murein transglycosylase D
LLLKNEVAINTAQASVDSFKKEDNIAAQNRNRLLCSKGDSLYSIAKKSWDNDFRY